MIGELYNFLDAVLRYPPATFAASVAAFGVAWSGYAVVRQREGHPLHPNLVIAPLLVLVVLLPVGGRWIEQMHLTTLAGLYEDQVPAAWRMQKQRAWGEFPGAIAMFAAPAASVLLAGVRPAGAAWHRARTAWACVVTLGVLVLVVPALRTFGAIEVAVCAFALIGLRGAWALARVARSETERLHHRTTAATVATAGALLVAGYVASGHIRAFHDGLDPLASRGAHAALEARRQATHDTSWREGLLVVTVLCFPLLTEGIRRRSLLAITLPAVAIPIAVAEPSWVRERPVPPIPASPPYDGPALEIVESPPREPGPTSPRRP